MPSSGRFEDRGVAGFRLRRRILEVAEDRRSGRADRGWRGPAPRGGRPATSTPATLSRIVGTTTMVSRVLGEARLEVQPGQAARLREDGDQPLHDARGELARGKEGQERRGGLQGAAKPPSSAPPVAAATAAAAVTSAIAPRYTAVACRNTARRDDASARPARGRRPSRARGGPCRSGASPRGPSRPSGSCSWQARARAYRHRAPLRPGPRRRARRSPRPRWR